MTHDLASEFTTGGDEMPVDYAEALRDLDAQIAFHETQIETLKSARPGFVALRNALNGGFKVPVPAATIYGRFAGMGNQAAVRALMADGQLRTREEIYRDLKAEGFTSDAKDPAGSVGATLSQMKDELERVEDRWRKKILVERITYHPTVTTTATQTQPAEMCSIPAPFPFATIAQPSPFEQ